MTPHRNTAEKYKLVSRFPPPKDTSGQTNRLTDGIRTCWETGKLPYCLFVTEGLTDTDMTTRIDTIALTFCQAAPQVTIKMNTKEGLK